MKLVIKKSEWLWGDGNGRLHDKDLNKSCAMGHYLLSLGYTKEEISPYKCMDYIAYHLPLINRPELKKLIYQPNLNERFYATSLSFSIEHINDNVFISMKDRIDRLKELFKTIDVDLEIID